MDVFIMVAQLIFGLSILVFVHEMGHFLAAKAFGIKVDKFYIFFDAYGKKLFSFKKGETEYGIGWIPLGGYVKISGMIDESMDKEQMKMEPQPHEFRSKPAWQRFIVMIGGIFMNIVLGIIIYSMSLYVFHEKYIPLDGMKYGIYAYDLAREIGLETGDKILALNGKEISRFKDIRSAKMLLGSSITVDRNGEIIDIPIPKGFYKKFAQKGAGAFIGIENIPFSVDSIIPDSPADSAGLKAKDVIKTVNGEEVNSYGLFREKMKLLGGQNVVLQVDRSGRSVDLNSRIRKEGTIGFAAKFDYVYPEIHYTIASSFAFGYMDAFQDLLYQSIIPFGKIFTNEIDASESIQGPIGIMRIYGPTWDWKRFWYLTGLISMVLAFMNFLPIPALDGGHIVFILIEIVMRKKVKDEILEKAQIVGMIILLSLMALVVGNDIYKWVVDLVTAT